MDDKYFDIFGDTSKLQIISAPERQERRTKIEDVFDRNGTRHEAVVPLSANYSLLPTTFPTFTAKEYQFELDDFQKISVCSLERDESVLVSAHTSSGKTVVAEYAIAMSLKNNQRVVYTSPIKALSNQKYRELLSEFGDVGLMTGDVTINPTASCLVMTTEILRNMLYRGGEVIREVHWIIFDEIHYIRDRERGVVWEETIILLPKHVRMVFLSATIPNALEFAEWICFIQNQVVHVVYTEKRVTPLVHYFRTDKNYLIKDTAFHKNNLLLAMKGVQKRNISGKDIAEALSDASLPVVIFSFRRKDCEKFALKVEQDYLTPEEKETVTTIFNNAIESLRKEDREIPIIQNILPLLLRGVGIHHSGLLPIIKEVVEILFQEGLLKVLFATETFSIGLNMPAKTVFFTALKKFDGETMRFVSSGEYIQMSGRAGRRGIDKMGIVVSLISEPISPKEVNSLFAPNSDILISAFRLTYNMILNLMRVDGLDPLYLISRSFHHYQAYKKGISQEDSMIAMYNALQYHEPNELANLCITREMKKQERNASLISSYTEYLQKGRVVDLFVPRQGGSLLIKNAIVSKVKGDIFCLVLVGEEVYSASFPLSYIDKVYTKRVKLDERVFERDFEEVIFEHEINQELSKIEKAIMELDPHFSFNVCHICGYSSSKCLTDCSNYLINGEKITSFSKNRKEASGQGNRKHSKSSPKRTKGNPRDNHSAISTPTKYQRPYCQNYEDAKNYFISEKMKADYSQKLAEFNALKDVYHMEECKKMIQVLKRLEYCDDTTVLIKGRLACEISSGDELILTEMIFNGDFANMSVEEYVSLLSCLVFEEHDSENFILSEENKNLFKCITDAVEKVSAVLRASGIDIAPETYLERFSYELMDVVRMWVCGHTFLEICNKTSVFEGSIIRTFKRLEELLRQLSSAARVIGNTELENMFSMGIFKIKRDIVFANSLYL